MHRAHLPLSALLSHALVAFTMEFDNEAEHRMPHSTTRHGASAAQLPSPWLVSRVMWINCMKSLGEEIITIRELERRARTSTNLDGMRRWGYIHILPQPAHAKPKPIRPDFLVQATSTGRRVQEIWRSLDEEVEIRWQKRFGAEQISGLREALVSIAAHLNPQLPDCLPILRFGLFHPTHTRKSRAAKASGTPSDATATSPATDLSSVAAASLPALLAKLLLAFAREFESLPYVSLAAAVNVLRLVPEEGVRLKDLPSLSGVSKESIAMAMTFLTERGLATESASASGSRFRLVTLTPQGRRVCEASLARIEKIEARWQESFGQAAILRLRSSLEQLDGDGTATGSPLFQGLEPYPENWRASVPKPQVLPDFPMVLHRGGYPDGS